MEKIIIDTYDTDGNLISARTSWIYSALVKDSILKLKNGETKKVAYVKESIFSSPTFGDGAVIRPSSVPNSQYIIVAPSNFENLLRERIMNATGLTLEDCTVQNFFDAFEAQCIETPVVQWDLFANNATNDSNRDMINNSFDENSSLTITTADGDIYNGILNQMTTQGNMSVFFDWVESCLPPQILSLETNRIIDNKNPSRILLNIHLEGAIGMYKMGYGDTLDVKLDIRF